jgi:endonuclease/exonuclease/phosphatase family metal-dependent hydrolase
MLGLASVGALAPASADAYTPPPEVTVMTRNLYLGADLAPALTATDAASFLGGVATIYGTAQYTSFPTRAKALAAEVAANKPDLVGLQEVSQWVTSGPGVPASQDFLAILLNALAQKGLHYTAAVTSNNANIGPIPLVTPCGSTVVGACLVTLQDRDVILVNQDRKGLTWVNPRSGNYATQQAFTTPFGGPPLSFNRGWTSIDVTVASKAFRFVNTHLETEDFPAVQVAQATEFLGTPILGADRVIVVGDFNSATNGSTTTTYAQLTKVLYESWVVKAAAPRVSCCQSGTLTNPTSLATTRIDLIMGRGRLEVLCARLTGTTPIAATAPRWASDHFGLVATYQVS